MEAPAHIVDELKTIRSSFELRWNPKAILVKPGSFDASGHVIHADYDGRSELWENATDYSAEYMVMRLQTPEGHYYTPNAAWLEFVRHINPENWGGDPHKMLAYFADRPNDLMQFVAEQDQEDLDDRICSLAGWVDTTKSPIAATNSPEAPHYAGRLSLAGA